MSERPVIAQQVLNPHFAPLAEQDMQQECDEKARQSSEECFRRVFEEGPLGVVIADLDARIQRVNPRFCQMLGYSEREIIELGIQGITHSEDWEQDREPGSRLLRGEIPGYCVEKRYLCKGGEVIWAQLTIFMMTGADGKATAIIGLIEDVTERKRAERRLRESERRLNTLISNLPGAVYRCRADANWTVDFLSDGYLALTGYLPSERIGQPGTRHSELIHPEDRQGELERMQQAVARKAPYQVEYRLRTASGEEKWVWEQGVGIFSESGELEAIEGFTTDITDRKRAEKELRASETKYRRLYQSMREAFVGVDMSGRIVEFNDAYCEMLGYKPEELLTLTYSDATPEEWHPFEAHIVDTQILQRRYSDTYEKEYRRRDGTIVPVELRTFLVTDDDDQPTGMCAIVRDITQRKAAEAALRRSHGELERRVEERTAELVRVNESLRAEIQERSRVEEDLRRSEAKYKALVESSPDAVGMCDLEGTILFASRRAADQHGFDNAEQLVGRPATDLVVPQDRDRMLANIRSLIQEGLRRNDQYCGLRRDGTTFFVEISATIIRGPTGQPQALMGVYQDITKRKLAEDRLRAKDAELLAAAEIQAHLLPQESPQLPGFDIAGRCYPAEVAAGDHFDFLWLSDGSLLVVMGDVSGHGLGPAIVAADFCARLRTLSDSLCELREIAVRTNLGLCRETAGEVFVTAILGRLDAESRSLTYLNAGHPAAFVLNSAGEVKARLSEGGLPFAILPMTPFFTGPPVELADDDLVFFYTDGLTEVHRRGEPFFGVERAIRIVRANQHRTADEIIAALYHAACEHIAPNKIADDITMVVIKVLPRAPESPGAGRQLASGETTSEGDGTADGGRYRAGASSFRVAQDEGFTIVRFEDTKYFDTEHYSELQHDLVNFVEREQPDKLLADLSDVEYCSTALINALLMVQRRVQARSGVMKLFGLREIVQETLQQLKLVGTLFSVCVDEIAAKNACE
jgi:PAS domain S-box-containing protein